MIRDYDDNKNRRSIEKKEEMKLTSVVGIEIAVSFWNDGNDGSVGDFGI